MHSRLKTGRTLASSSAVRLTRAPAIFIVTIILLGSNALPQSDSTRLGMSANELARKVITNELKIRSEEHDHWMYRLEKEESGKKRVEEIVETNNGSLSQLFSMDGHSLDAKERQKENLRLQRLVTHPGEQRKLQQASNKKADRGERLFAILPDVFVFAYAGRQGDLVTLAFRPNATFRPHSIATRVFYGMYGEMTVDTKQDRLAGLNGHLVEDVKFAGGLLGYLDKGGKFSVEQAEVAAGYWEITALVVDMKGKALLFKTIDVQETENHSDFHRVPDDITLAQAAGMLNRQIVVADNR